MEEIICSIPYWCNAWYESNFWIHDDGSFSIDKFGQGNHSQIKDLPNYKEIKEAWEKYYFYVAKQGFDPLNAFYFKKEFNFTKSYTAKFEKVSNTPLLIELKNSGGQKLNISNLKPEINSYLNLKFDTLNSKSLRHFYDGTWDEFINFSEVNPDGDYAVANFSINFTKSKPQDLIEKKLKCMAKNRLKNTIEIKNEEYCTVFAKVLIIGNFESRSLKNRFYLCFDEANEAINQPTKFLYRIKYMSNNMLLHTGNVVCFHFYQSDVKQDTVEIDKSSFIPFNIAKNNFILLKQPSNQKFQANYLKNKLEKKSIIIDVWENLDNLSLEDFAKSFKDRNLSLNDIRQRILK